MPAMLMITCSAENGLRDKAGKGQSKHERVAATADWTANSE